ncbi:hypothetical protein [Larsenimonas salina]|uniref:hypothetical protein n=1 Tax=Larsenimonas salina TaxID=1295565 RepID=UPI002074888C|nr:hypothetical protein [Larsenimonas salina]MCM5703983.1 hypothetical protein [Larsenimonas salina]
MEPNPNLARYLTPLDAHGIESEVVDPHAARLISDDIEFMLVVADDEPAFFQLILPNAWQTSADDDSAILLEAANDVMNAIKAAKIVLHSEGLHLSVEQFVSGPDQGAALLPGLVELLKSATGELHERLGMGHAPRIH